MIMKPQPKLHEELNCEGYWGFATGYELPTTPKPTGYCNDCPVAKACWEKHKARVREMVPDLVAEFEEMAKAFPGRGEELVQKWFDKYGQPDPYVTVGTGNIEDGACCGSGVAVKDRERGTLPEEFWKPIAERHRQ